MTSKSIILAVAAAALGFGSLAQAQDRDWQGHRGHDERQQQYQQPGYQQPQHEQRHDWRQGNAQPQQQWQHQQWQPQQWQSQQQWRSERSSQWANRAPDRWDRGYVAQARPRYWAGGYVPNEYRHSHYYVNDWRARNLYAPPYGYQWIETDTGDYLLMALATGLIANLVLNGY